VRKVILFILNNIVFNRLLIWLGQDHFIKRFGNNWANNQLDQKKSLQENVGFSHTESVDKAIQLIHQKVKEIDNKYLQVNDKVLDIGCGVGLYLKDFENKQLFGTDLNAAFLDKCKELVPGAQLLVGDYLDISFQSIQFDFIYSISVIEYIPPSRIHAFFKKVHNELKPEAYVLIQYPHAMNWKDKYYADLSYISYLPEYLESVVKEQFEIVEHLHSYDGRSFRGIDTISYSGNVSRSFCNGMFLFLKKR
jgi:cyclopropane fatty-acyl-phospholipid synthase-like methyltransferase